MEKKNVRTLIFAYESRAERTLQWLGLGNQRTILSALQDKKQHFSIHSDETTFFVVVVIVVVVNRKDFFPAVLSMTLGFFLD